VDISAPPPTTAAPPPTTPYSAAASTYRIAFSAYASYAANLPRSAPRNQQLSSPGVTITGYPTAYYGPWSYSGCFNQTASIFYYSGYYNGYYTMTAYVLEYFAGVDPYMTVDICAQKCGQLGYIYAGMTGLGSEDCYCGNNYPAPAGRVADSVCNGYINGNINQFAGSVTSYTAPNGTSVSIYSIAIYRTYLATPSPTPGTPPYFDTDGWPYIVPSQFAYAAAYKAAYQICAPDTVTANAAALAAQNAYDASNHITQGTAGSTWIATTTGTLATTQQVIAAGLCIDCCSCPTAAVCGAGTCKKRTPIAYYAYMITGAIAIPGQYPNPGQSLGILAAMAHAFA